MNRRIFDLRKKKGLNQEQFAEELGLSRSFVNQVETGKRNISERTIADICRVFNVNEEWLRTGEGEMFREKSNNELEALADRYNLSQEARILVEEFVKLKPGIQHTIIDCVRKTADALTVSAPAPLDQPDHPGGEEPDPKIEREVERYRQMLLAERRRVSQTSTASELDAG